MRDNALRGDCTLAADGELRLLQITDMHLMAERGGTLLNMDTDDSLEAVVDTAVKRAHEPHALLITGDIAGDGSAAAYSRLEQALKPLGAPSVWLPGNHDGCSQAHVPTERFSRSLTTPHWHVVMLNSQVEDQVGGHLAAQELEALSAAVDTATTTQRHLLVALHHPLHALGCAWLDPQRVDNASVFMTEVGRCQKSVVVISGHVHQANDLTVEGSRCLTSPSTCIQFEPGQANFKVHDIAPGYRWLTLHQNGDLETAVVRVEGRSFVVDLDSGGYL